MHFRGVYLNLNSLNPYKIKSQSFRGTSQISRALKPGWLVAHPSTPYRLCGCGHTCQPRKVCWTTPHAPTASPLCAPPPAGPASSHTSPPPRQLPPTFKASLSASSRSHPLTSQPAPSSCPSSWFLLECQDLVHSLVLEAPWPQRLLYSLQDLLLPKTRSVVAF